MAVAAIVALVTSIVSTLPARAATWGADFMNPKWPAAIAVGVPVELTFWAYPDGSPPPLALGFLVDLPGLTPDGVTMFHNGVALNRVRNAAGQVLLTDPKPVSFAGITYRTSLTYQLKFLAAAPPGNVSVTLLATAEGLTRKYWSHRNIPFSNPGWSQPAPSATGAAPSATKPATTTTGPTDTVASAPSSASVVMGSTQPASTRVTGQAEPPDGTVAVGQREATAAAPASDSGGTPSAIFIAGAAFLGVGTIVVWLLARRRRTGPFDRDGKDVNRSAQGRATPGRRPDATVPFPPQPPGAPYNAAPADMPTMVTPVVRHPRQTRPNG